MGSQERKAARIERAARATLAELVDDPAASGRGGRASSHRLLQNVVRAAQRDQANTRRTR